jgi:hypothetical protein
MNKDFSLDSASESIYNFNTKKYFKEVLQSYHNENYRATVVMLYSIVICDLVYKLIELRDVYDDDKAENVLSEIEKMQTSNPKSSDWEKKLFKLVDESTSLFPIGTLQNIEILQNHRHLCAHPVMDSSYKLFSPNKETTKAHMRNMVEDIFIRRPLLSKNVFNKFIEDLDKKKDIFAPEIPNKDLEKYLSAKYLDQATDRTIEHLFKNLWKFTFRLDNEKCKENRSINIMSLHVIYSKHEHEMETNISKDPVFYSQIESGEPCQNLIGFISMFPKIYDLLDSDAKIILKKEADNSNEFKIRAWYLSDTLYNHLEKIKTLYNAGDLIFYKEPSNARALSILIRNTHEYDSNQDIINFAIDLYINSISFFQADFFFKNLIKPNLKYMTSTNFIKLLKGVCDNDQTYKRKNSKSEHAEIRKIVEDKYPDIEVSSYPEFYDRLEKKKDSDSDDLPF